MNLSSFDVGFLIATIFGKLKLPPKVDLRSEFKDHKFCILDTQDLYSGKTRSGNGSLYNIVGHGSLFL